MNTNWRSRCYRFGLFGAVIHVDAAAMERVGTRWLVGHSIGFRRVINGVAISRSQQIGSQSLGI
jgi:hypothetical protein